MGYTNKQNKSNNNKTAEFGSWIIEYQFSLKSIMVNSHGIPVYGQLAGSLSL